MKQIDFREINSKKYTNKTSNNNHKSQNNTKNSTIDEYHKKNIVTHKKKHQTYQEAFFELNEHINNVITFTLDYINRKKKEKGFFGRIISKLIRIDDIEREEWIEEVSKSPQIERWMDKIDNLVNFIYDFYDEDLTDYVESKLGNLFPDYY